MDSFENLYLPLPIAWFQWHSSPNHLELFKPQFSTFGENQIWKKKVLNSDFKSRNCKERYLQGVRHMKICPCLSSQILRHSHLPREISLPSLQLFFPWIGEETSFLETQTLQHNKSLWFLKNIVKKKFQSTYPGYSSLSKIFYSSSLWGKVDKEDRAVNLYFHNLPP